MKGSIMKGVLAGFAVLVGLSGLVETAGAVPVFFDTVVSFTPGTGSGVFDSHDPISGYTGPSGPGTFDPAAVTALDRVRLALGGDIGTPGAIVLGFSDGREFFDRRGYDVFVYSTLRNWVLMEFSYDGATFFRGQATSWVSTERLGSGQDVYYRMIDLAPTGLASAKFLRLTTIPLSAGAGYPAGYTLDAAKALYFAQGPKSLEPLPEPSTWVLLGTGLMGLLGYGWRQRRPTP